MKLLRNLLWLSLSVLLPACGSDETDRKENGGGNPDSDRREIMIELQNGLRPVSITRSADDGGQHTDDGQQSGATRAGIAEADENRIRSLDIYVFACPEEEGQYTLSDRFCYRADNEPIPVGAQKLDFKCDENTGQARVVCYPRKGMYCHFFCVANNTELLREDDTAYTGFKPLALSNALSADGTGIGLAAAGSPTEEEFLHLLPPPLKAGDVLRAPLMMSGATLLPIDLRSPSLGSSIRLNMRLTRTVARFDIVNNALQSHLTITSIGLDRGRRRVSLFPIAPVDGPEGEESTLITYADAPFDMPTANLGTTTKAFYCYPSPMPDGAALIIKGYYALNQTDQPVEVSYRIPFEQSTGGSGTRIDVAHNHRYTLQITRADKFKLDHVLKIEDWADEGSLEQDLNNDLDELKISDLTPTGKTTYNPLTETVTMSIDPVRGESSFTVHTASNSGVSAALNFVLASQNQRWLKLEEMIPDADYQHKGSQAAKFKITVIPEKVNEGCPRAVLRLTDSSGKFEKVLIIMPEPIPLPIPTTPVPESAGGKLNVYDTTDKTLHLYRVKGSTVQLKLSCPDGTTADQSLNSWLEVKRTGGTDLLSTFTLTLTDPEVELTDDRSQLTFSNKNQPDLKQTVILVLHEAEVTDLAISDHAGLSALDAMNKEVEMTVTLNSQFRFSALAYDAVKVEKIEYANGSFGKVDNWLEYTEESTTRTIADAFSTRSINLPMKIQSNLVFRMKDAAQYFGPATVTLKNTCLGPDLILKVLPEYPVPTVSASTPMTPEPNNYDDANKTLYLLQQADGKTSVGTLSVYSPGGSKLVLPADVSGLTLNRTDSELPTEKYTLSWTGTNSTLTDHDVTLQVKNASAPDSLQAITVKALGTDISDLTLTPKETGSATLDLPAKAITMNMKEGNTFTLRMKSYGGQVKVESCPSFLDAPATTRSMPQKTETSLTFTLKSGNNGVNAKSAEDLVLANPCGGPKLTLRVTPVYIAPIVSGAGTMTPSNANKWDAADNTLYLVQQSAGKTSSGILTIYSLGGSTIEPPTGTTASLLNSDEKSQQYELRWAGSDAANLSTQNLTLKLKNKSDATKITDVKMQLLPNIISNLTLAPKSSGTASLSGTTVTVDITAGNWFKLTMKAYGNSTRVQVKSKPDWLTASSPATTRTAPVKEQTAITFTVDGTKTAFAQGNIVLTNPSGGPDLTVLVKPKYMKPAYNANSGLTTCNSYGSNSLNLVQPRSGSSNGTLRIYALGGSRAELISATDGLSISSNTLTTATYHDYPLKWAPSNPNNARSDRSITLRIWNFDNSQYLDQTIKLVANGSLDIYNTKYNADKWDIAAKRSGAVAQSAGLSINIVANATFEIHTNSYGGMTLAGNPSWLTGTKYQETPAITTAYATKINSRFRFTIKSQNGSYPAGNITLRPVLGGPDFVVSITPVYQAPAITAGAMNPNGVNNYDSGQGYVYLVQRAAGQNSTAQLSVYSLGGSKLTFPAYSGFSVSPSNSATPTQIYTLTWTGNNNALTANKDIALTFANNSDASKKKVITARLMPNTLRNIKITAQTGGVSLTGGTLAYATSGTLNVPIVKGAGFTISMECYGGTPGVSAKPGWLQQGAITRASPNSQTHTFRFDLIENAANFNDTQLVFTNPSGGPGLTLNIARGFQAPTVTDGGSASPAVNNFSGNTLNIYRTKGGKSSTRLLKVYSLGGSTLTSLGNWHNLTEENVSGQTSNCVKFYRVGHNTSATDASYGDGYDGTFNVQNTSDKNKQTPIKIHFVSSRVSWAHNRADGINIHQNGTDANTWAYFDAKDARGIYNQSSFTLTIYSPAGVTFNAGASSIDDKFTVVSNSESTSGYYKANVFTFTLKSTTTMSGAGGNDPLGEMHFSSKDGNNFFNFYFKCYNYVPILTGCWGTRVTQPYGNKKSFFICKSNVYVRLWDAKRNVDNTNVFMTNGWRYPMRNDLMWLVTNDIYWDNTDNVQASSVVSPNLDILCTYNDYPIQTNEEVSKKTYHYVFYYKVGGSLNQWNQKHWYTDTKIYLHCIHD